MCVFGLKYIPVKKRDFNIGYWLFFGKAQKDPGRPMIWETPPSD